MRARAPVWSRDAARWVQECDADDELDDELDDDLVADLDIQQRVVAVGSDALQVRDMNYEGTRQITAKLLRGGVCIGVLGGYVIKPKNNQTQSLCEKKHSVFGSNSPGANT